MTTRKYFDRRDGSVLHVDSAGVSDNNVLFYVRAEEAVSLTTSQVENLIAFLQGDRVQPVKLWEDAV